MCAMPQSSRMMVTLAASRSHRLTLGFPFAWSSAGEEARNRRRKTRFFGQQQIFMRFFFLRSARLAFFGDEISLPALPFCYGGYPVPLLAFWRKLLPIQLLAASTARTCADRKSHVSCKQRRGVINRHRKHLS